MVFTQYKQIYLTNVIDWTVLRTVFPIWRVCVQPASVVFRAGMFCTCACSRSATCGRRREGLSDEKATVWRSIVRRAREWVRQKGKDSSSMCVWSESKVRSNVTIAESSSRIWRIRIKSRHQRNVAEQIVSAPLALHSRPSPEEISLIMTLTNFEAFSHLFFLVNKVNISGVVPRTTKNDD